jgi:hypothetical protein
MSGRPGQANNVLLKSAVCRTHLAAGPKQQRPVHGELMIHAAKREIGRVATAPKLLRLAIL